MLKECYSMTFEIYKQNKNLLLLQSVFLYKKILLVNYNATRYPPY
jgi:hypothetical protein